MPSLRATSPRRRSVRPPARASWRRASAGRRSARPAPARRPTPPPLGPRRCTPFAQAAVLRRRPARALVDQSDAAMAARVDFEQQAGLAVVTPMQDERRLLLLAHSARFFMVAETRERARIV